MHTNRSGRTISSADFQSGWDGELASTRKHSIRYLVLSGRDDEERSGSKNQNHREDQAAFIRGWQRRGHERGLGGLHPPLSIHGPDLKIDDS